MTAIDLSDPMVVTHEKRLGSLLVEHTGGGLRRWYVVDPDGKTWGPHLKRTARRMLRRGWRA